MEKNSGSGGFRDLRPDKNLRILSEREERRLEAIEEAVKDDDTTRGEPTAKQMDHLIGGKREDDTRGRAKPKTWK